MVGYSVYSKAKGQVHEQEASYLVNYMSSQSIVARHDLQKATLDSMLE
jgi:hypothetical protein